MTTVTRTPTTVIAAATGNGTAGSTKGAPAVDSGWLSTGSADGGNLMLSILNGASAPGVAGTLQVQVSVDAAGTRARDYQAIGGDTNAYNASTLVGLTSACIWVDPGIQYYRVFGYGNTTNTVTFSAEFSGVTRA